MLSTIRNGGTVRLRFRLRTGSTTTTLIAGAGDLVEGQWVHVAGVYDGATMRLYQDGVEVGSASKTGNVAQSAVIRVFLGANPPGVDKPWDGTLRDVRIYERALSPAEVLVLSTED
jgi:hypothetical protein